MGSDTMAFSVSGLPLLRGNKSLTTGVHEGLPSRVSTPRYGVREKGILWKVPSGKLTQRKRGLLRGVETGSTVTVTVSTASPPSTRKS